LIDNELMRQGLPGDKIRNDQIGGSDATHYNEIGTKSTSDADNGENMTPKISTKKATAKRRQQALDELQKLADEVRSRNRDLSAAEATALADRFFREVIEEMSAEGKIEYDA
jgi:hypothetical protein